MPPKFRRNKGPKPRGVAARNAAMRWIVDNAEDEGVMYFADDDNAYDIRLFEEVTWIHGTRINFFSNSISQIRRTRTLSFFPVGLIGKLGISSPIVKNGKITGFFDSWLGSRVFAVDMAGFAVAVSTLRSAWLRAGGVEMPYKVSYEEDGFLRQLGVSLGEAEALAVNCSVVLVWHTRTWAPARGKAVRMDTERLRDTNIPSLYAAQ